MYPFTQEWLKSSMYFHYILIISRWKKVGVQLEFPSFMDALCQFGWNWPSGFGEEDLLKSLMYFRNFVIISPWIGPLFEQSWIPFTQGYFVPGLVEIDQLVLEKKIWLFVNVFSQFRNYLPLEEGRALHLNKLESPHPRKIYAKFI